MRSIPLRRAALSLAGAIVLAAGARAAPPPYSEQGFLDAAYKNCAEVENREAKSCECEQKLIKDRVEPADKEMAYYYWVDQKTYMTRYNENATKDPEWAAKFSDRFTTIQALIIAACGA
jgi:hypothetical protein